MRPAWREILVGWLAECAVAQHHIFISRAQCEFIERLMGGDFPLSDREVESRLMGRLTRPGWIEYCKAVYRDFMEVIEEGQVEFKLTPERALAILVVATDSGIFQEVNKRDDRD